MLITLFISALCLVALRFLYKNYVADSHQKLENFDKFPYTILPLIGHLHRYWWLSDVQLFKKLLDDFKDLTKSTVLWFGAVPIVFLTNPEDIHMFLSSPISSQKGTGFKALFGSETALITSNMLIWKPLRQHMNSLFNNSSMKSFLESFNYVTELLINDVDEQCGQGYFDIGAFIGKAGSTIAIRSHLKGDLVEKDVLFNIYRKIENILDRNGHRMLRVYIYYAVMKFKKIFRMSSAETRMCNYVLNKIGVDVEGDIKRARDSLDQKKNTNYFYERLIHLTAIGVVREDDITENLSYFFAASANTASTAISSTLLLLAMHPEVQETLYDELNDTLDTNVIDHDALSKLSYLDRVVKESLRLLPSVPILNRKTHNKDFQLDHRIIPKNTDVVISIFNLHRNRAFWGEDAEKFNPDNFLPDNFAQRRHCYMPFAMGERHCIANKYSMLQIKVMVALLILRYRFTTFLKLDDLELGFSLTIKILNEAMVSVTRR